MSAKFVNLIEFFELKIFLKLKMERFIPGSLNCNGIVLSLNVIDVRPDEKPALRQGGNGDTRVMQGHIFGGQHFFLAPKQVNVGYAHQHMPHTRWPFFREAGCNANTDEKNN